MVSREVKYTDFSGNVKTKTLMFHYTTLELSNMQISEEGGLKAKLQRIVDTKDENASIKFIQDFIIGAYGEVSDDGERFIKTSEITENLKSSAAFSQFLAELYKSEDALLNFIKSIVPETAL